MLNLNLKRKWGRLCDKALAPGAVCVVPESLGGLPVTELADKGIFGGVRWRKSIYRGHSPGSEDMNFMDVRSFRRSILRALREVGGGVFTGCRNIRSLTVHMGVDEESALRDFVTEINERES